ncbi:MAG TPA: hypothetical protein VFX45_01045 [Solirubrobacterales bacterium]|nr:hypothetical protein [Solirubrobacterales bacterium]
MTRRAIISGACALCLAAVCAAPAFGKDITTPSFGTTAFTCTQTASGAEFSDEHCKTAGTGSGYRHVLIEQGKTTTVTVTNETTEGKTSAARLLSTIAGVKFELVATTTTGQAWMKNGKSLETIKVKTEGEDNYFHHVGHFVHGEATTTYTGVTVAKPAGGGCKAYTDNGSKGEEGSLHTETLTATTAAQGDFGKLEPKEGSVFLRFFLEGCVNSGLNGTYTITGSVKCPAEGATVVCTHENTTSQNTLKLNGAIKAGVDVSTTFKGKDPSFEDTYKPLSVTTVETS